MGDSYPKEMKPNSYLLKRVCSELNRLDMNYCYKTISSATLHSHGV